jgi:hypothetical protein
MGTMARKVKHVLGRTLRQAGKRFIAPAYALQGAAPKMALTHSRCKVRLGLPRCRCRQRPSRLDHRSSFTQAHIWRCEGVSAVITANLEPLLQLICNEIESEPRD